jgi:hypothetical protein
MGISCTDGHMFSALTVGASILRTFDDAERLENRGLILGLNLALALVLAFTLNVPVSLYTGGGIREH